VDSWDYDIDYFGVGGLCVGLEKGEGG